MNIPLECRCCGKLISPRLDDHPIHTMCIRNHWTRHNKGLNNSRCREFKHKGP